MNKYICLELKQRDSLPKKSRYEPFLKILIRFLTFILPHPPPNHEGLWHQAVTWHLEIDDEGWPIREIGLDPQQRVVVVGSFDDDWSYFLIDNGPFNAAEYTQVTPQQFWREWNSFAPPTVLYHYEHGHFVFDLYANRIEAKGAHDDDGTRMVFLTNISGVEIDPNSDRLKIITKEKEEFIWEFGEEVESAYDAVRAALH